MSLPQGYNLLREFPNRYYIETGTYRGDSLALALESGAFQEMHGIEISQEQIAFCKNRFDLYRSPRSDMHLHLGDSADILHGIVSNLLFGPGETGSITFFLDAHWQMFEGTDKGKNPFPILAELKQIYDSMRGGFRFPTIIIDDWHIFYDDLSGIKKSTIQRYLRMINPDYKLRFFANPVIDGLLVAHP